MLQEEHPSSEEVTTPLITIFWACERKKDPIGLGKNNFVFHNLGSLVKI
jgi:hypothetical protein